ncbi:MAG TPA: hypothetical protein VF972_05090, partial [Actinomycetota bacterium]
GIAVGAGAVWASSIRDRLVARIDPTTDLVTGTAAVGGGPRSIVVLRRSLWVAEFDQGNVAGSTWPREPGPSPRRAG